jgi:hypothetical protein
MSQKLEQIMLPPIRCERRMQIIDEFIGNIINKNTYNDIVKSLDTYYQEIIKPTEDIKYDFIGDTSKYSTIQLTLVEIDFKAFESIKNLGVIKNKPKIFKKNLMTLLIMF